MKTYDLMAIASGTAVQVIESPGRDGVEPVKDNQSQSHAYGDIRRHQPDAILAPERGPGGLLGLLVEEKSNERYRSGSRPLGPPEDQL